MSVDQRKLIMNAFIILAHTSAIVPYYGCAIVGR